MPVRIGSIGVSLLFTQLCFGSVIAVPDFHARPAPAVGRFGVSRAELGVVVPLQNVSAFSMPLVVPSNEPVPWGVVVPDPTCLALFKPIVRAALRERKLEMRLEQGKFSLISRCDSVDGEVVQEFEAGPQPAIYFLDIVADCRGRLPKDNVHWESVQLEVEAETACPLLLVFTGNVHFGFPSSHFRQPAGLVSVRNGNEVPSALKQQISFDTRHNALLLTLNATTSEPLWLPVAIGESLPEVVFHGLTGCAGTKGALRFFARCDLGFRVDANDRFRLRTDGKEIVLTAPSENVRLFPTRDALRILVDEPGRWPHSFDIPLCPATAKKELDTDTLITVQVLISKLASKCGRAHVSLAFGTGPNTTKAVFLVPAEAPTWQDLLTPHLPTLFISSGVAVFLLALLTFACFRRRTKSKIVKVRPVAVEDEHEPGTLSLVLEREARGETVCTTQGHFKIVRPLPEGDAYPKAKVEVPNEFDYHKFESETLEPYGLRPFLSEPPPRLWLCSEFWSLFEYLLVPPRKTACPESVFAVRDCVAFERKGFRSLANRMLETMRPSLVVAVSPKASCVSVVRAFVLAYDPLWLEVHVRGPPPAFLFRLFRCTECERLATQLKRSNGLHSDALSSESWARVCCAVKRVPFGHHAFFSYAGARPLLNATEVNHVFVIRGQVRGASGIRVMPSCRFPEHKRSLLAHRNQIAFQTVPEVFGRCAPGSRFTLLDGYGNVVRSKPPRVPPSPPPPVAEPTKAVEPTQQESVTPDPRSDSDVLESNTEQTTTGSVKPLSLIETE